MGHVYCRHGLPLDVTIDARLSDDSQTVVVTQTYCTTCLAEAFEKAMEAQCEPLPSSPPPRIR
jgi:hypothetical protein